MKDIKVGGKWIGQNHRPFIIAEMSGNHNLLYCDSMIIRLEAYSNFSLVAILIFLRSL